MTSKGGERACVLVGLQGVAWTMIQHLETIRGCDRPLLPSLPPPCCRLLLLRLTPCPAARPCSGLDNRLAETRAALAQARERAALLMGRLQAAEELESLIPEECFAQP